MIEPFKASNKRTFSVRFKDGYIGNYYDVHQVEYLRGTMDEPTVMLHSEAGTYTFKLREVQEVTCTENEQ